MPDRVVGSLEREHQQLLAFMKFRGTKAVFIAKPENAETRSNEPSLLAMTTMCIALIHMFVTNRERPPLRHSATYQNLDHLLRRPDTIYIRDQYNNQLQLGEKTSRASPPPPLRSEQFPFRHSPQKMIEIIATVLTLPFIQWFDYGLVTRLEIARYPNVYSLNFLLSLSRTHISHNGLAIGDSQLQQYSNFDLLPIHITLRHSLIRNRPSRVAKMKLMTGIITAIIAFFATTSFAESEGGFMEPCKKVSLKEAFYKPCKKCPRRAFYKVLAGCTALDGKPGGFDKSCEKCSLGKANEKKVEMTCYCADGVNKELQMNIIDLKEIRFGAVKRWESQHIRTFVMAELTQAVFLVTIGLALRPEWSTKSGFRNSNAGRLSSSSCIPTNIYLSPSTSSFLYSSYMHFQYLHWALLHNALRLTLLLLTSAEDSHQH
ncbi:uncharacterized protein CLUP02_06922 [Colletotrichum lupini]|uniref:Uncharacterized protein n=1 Tax=Colletotrichum lupini TaxID=145971 RepID=A0A9Q8SQ60_9PEZI|nr:uncharacterized protein CLUP02_06922 [Colletotrichum lupini]UQC81436.1 hypothetical protein CLUP02_06922 [Colletotrichum lupini]